MKRYELTNSFWARAEEALSIKTVKLTYKRRPCFTGWCAPEYASQYCGGLLSLEVKAVAGGRIHSCRPA